MEQATFGKSTLSVPRICIGCWQAAGWQNTTAKSFVETLHHAFSLGLTFLDTAEAYGDGVSESLVGEAIRGRRDKVIIATKFRHNMSRPDKVRHSLEGSLRRLGTDYVDIYQQHWPPQDPPLEETIAVLEELKCEGKIRFIGVSNWMEPEWQEFGNPWRIDSLQPCYNLLWRSIEPKVLPLCIEHRIAVLAYSPLCQGMLAGRFKSREQVPKDVRQQNRLFSQEFFPKAARVAEEVCSIAAKLHKTPAQVALRWVLDQPGVTSVICGVSSIVQIEENLGALGWELPAADRDFLTDISADLSKDLTAHDSLWNWHPREKKGK